MRNRKSVTTLNLDPDELDYFTKHLPGRKSVSEAIREYISSVNEEHRKKVEAHVTPINVSFSSDETLDKYIHNSLNNFLNLDMGARMKYLHNLREPQLTKVAINATELQAQISFVRNNRKRSKW
jgi:hypothetical protein